MKHWMRARCVASLAALALAGTIVSTASAAANDPFTTLASGFTQTLYATGLSCCGGVAFAPNGDPLFVSGSIFRIDSTTTTTIDGSAVHPVTITSPAVPLFFGVVNGRNGALYANTPNGVYEIDAAGNAIAGPAGAPGNGLGITVDPQTGNLVYPDANGNISWASEDLSASGVFAAGASSDGLVFDPSGNYLFTANFNAGINEYDRSGALVQNIPNSGSPDGMAFHAGVPNFLVSNNNDGSITRYDFPGGDLSQPPAQSVFASGGFRGDLSQVGADGCLYVTQAGTRFADGTTTSAGSLVQICPGFIPPAGPTTSVCPLYDTTKAVKLGATVPVRFYLCDASGNDVSSPSATVHATALANTTSNTAGTIEDSGHANPGGDFRYDPTLGPSGGYIFNLSTKPLSSGTWRLDFTSTGAIAGSFSIQFVVK